MIALTETPEVLLPGEVVEQTIDGGATARFRKQTIVVPLEQGSLVLVRKRAVLGPASRGAVLLLHGYAQNRYAWHTSRRSMSSYLAAEGFDVFNLDFRGAGRSRAAGTPGARGFADYVEGDLPRAIAAALEASGERRLFLVGHSLGGAVACAFAGRAPELIRGVVTLSGLFDFARSNRFVRMISRAAGALSAFGVAPYLLPDPLPTDLVGRILHHSRMAFDSRLAALSPVQAWYPGSVESDILQESIRRSFEPASLGLTLGLAAMASGKGFCDASGRCYFKDFADRRELSLLVATACSDFLVSSEDARAAFDRSRAVDRSLRSFEAATDGGCGWGHIDLIMGRNAPRHVWPAVRDWLAAR